MTSDGSERTRRLSRRRLLRWGAATATVAAAGCLGDEENGDDGNGDGNQTNDGGEENGDNNGENNNGENGESEGEYVEFDTEIETVVQLRGSVVGTGSIDTEEIHEWAVDEQRPGLPLSESGEVGSHSIYEVATDDSTAALAVDESDLVFSGNR